MKYIDMLFVMVNGYMLIVELRENKLKIYILFVIQVVLGLGV